MAGSRKAMTLVETLVALAIVGSLMAAISSIVEVVVRNRWIDDQEITIEDSVERVFDLLASDLRGGITSADPKSGSGDDAEYDLTDGLLLGMLTANYLEQLDAQAHWRGLGKVYYQLEAGNSGRDQRLIRTEVLPAGKDAAKSLHRECLLDSILTCELSARINGNWKGLDDWRKDYPDDLPSSLRIIVSVKDPKTAETKTFERLVIRSADYQFRPPQEG